MDYTDRANRDQLRVDYLGMTTLERELLDALDHLSAQLEESVAREAALVEHGHVMHECGDMCRTHVSADARELLEKARTCQEAINNEERAIREADAYREDAEKWRALKASPEARPQAFVNAVERATLAEVTNLDLQYENDALKEVLSDIASGNCKCGCASTAYAVLKQRPVTRDRLQRESADRERALVAAHKLLAERERENAALRDHAKFHARNCEACHDAAGGHMHEPCPVCGTRDYLAQLGDGQ